MPQIVLVAIGGALGAVFRFKLSGFFLHRYASTSFPIGTFACNVAGCLAIGLIAAGAEKYGWFSPEVRLLLITGILGGFTTFSAFGFETINLMRKGEVIVAGSYVLASVCLGLLSVWLGQKLAGV